MAAEFEKTITTAVADGSIAGGAAIAVDKNGKTLFSKAFGKTSLEENAKPFTPDTVMWIASCTKLLTVVTALQCVEKGLLKLDEPIDNVLPQWQNAQIMTGISDEGKPILKPATKKITLRRLLTHSSGMGLPGVDPLLTQLFGMQTNNSTIEKDYFHDLTYEPGEGWAYSPGLEYAGEMVKKVTGLTLEEHMRKHIWEPLGMNSSTFRPLQHPDIMSRMTGRVSRNEEGKLVKDESQMWTIHPLTDDYGGNGSYSCASDYIKVLTSLLMNDGKLLGKEMREELFRPQLETPQAFEALARHPIFGNWFSPGYPHNDTTDWDYGLGGALVNKDIPGHAGKGTIYWSGLPNSYWFIDPSNGVCGFYGSWLLPPGDAQTGTLYAVLQRAAVKEAAKL